MKRNIITLSLILILAFSFASCNNSKENTKNDSDSQTQTEEENKDENQDETGLLSSFVSTDIEGNAVDQDIFKNKKITMINIWATFCGPCINEMPELAELNNEYSDKDIQIIGIPIDVTDKKGNIIDNQVTEAKEIINTTGANYVHILPSESLLSAKLNTVYSVPETLFVDSNGNQIGKSYVGARNKEQWQKIIDSILEQTK